MTSFTVKYAKKGREKTKLYIKKSPKTQPKIFSPKPTICHKHTRQNLREYPPGVGKNIYLIVFMLKIAVKNIRKSTIVFGLIRIFTKF